MPKQSWERVDELFHQVIELEPDHRAAFLQESVSDPQIRKEVESLLAYEQRSANFIEDRVLLACELLAACEVPTPESNADTRVSCEEATPDPLVGTTVSRFRIIEKLGSGGMGLVYRAEDLELGRQVALKFLKRPGSDWVSEAERNSLERLYLEARASSALDHANICTIFEVDQHEGRPFLVMQLLVGRSLKQEVAGGPLSVDRVMKFGIQCASALVTAHGAGIVHRDIKSANIFLTQRQEVKVLDFGLAQSERLQANGQPEHQRDARAQLSGEDSLAHTLAAFGTAAYMSPQQILGEHLDGRADVFSLGVVLYEMATGQLPFQGENTADVLASVLQVVPPNASILNPSVPGQLANIIGRCLEKDLERRYQSAAELREALLRVQSALPGVSGSWSRKSFRLLLVLTAVACALASAAIFFFMQRGRSSNVRVARRDAVVLADFSNSTGEAVFDETLNQALRVQLEQSPHLNVLSPGVIAQEQQYMGMQPSAVVLPAAALKMCQRTGSDVMISGSIAALGSHYVIGLNVVNCQTGELLASEQAEVERREDVLPALGKEAHRVRSKLGESVASMQKFDAPVEEATTPSLAALRAYGVGLKTWYAEGEKASIPFFVKATELDPRFAMAYARLGNAYFETNQPTLARAAVTQAYELRDRVSERERLYIESHYYEQVSGELDKALPVFQLWQETYPDDPVPYVNLGADYTTLGKHELALEQDRKALQLEPDLGLLYSNLALEYVSMENYDSAEKALREAERRRLQYATLIGAAYEVAFLRGDQAEVQRQLQRGMNRPWTEAWLLALQADTEAYYGRRAQAEQFTRRAVASALRYDDPEAAVGYELMGALRDAEYGAGERAKATARKALAADDSQQSKVLAALALARSGDIDGALGVARELEKRFPADIMIQEYWVPTIRAAAELSRGEPSAAVQLLQAVAPYDLASPKTPTTAALYPVYLRGLAWLQDGQPQQASAEFQKILSHKGVAQNYLVFPLASLQLARAYKAMALQQRNATATNSGEGQAHAEEQAEAAYRDFLNIWTNADRNLPVLREAQREYRTLLASRSSRLRH